MEIEGYCVKCREKRMIQDPVAEYNAAGRAVTRGTCPVCGTSMYRIGETPAHAHVEKPSGGSSQKSAKADAGDKPSGKNPSGQKASAKSGAGEKATAKSGNR